MPDAREKWRQQGYKGTAVTREAFWSQSLAEIHSSVLCFLVSQSRSSITTAAPLTWPLAKQDPHEPKKTGMLKSKKKQLGVEETADVAKDWGSVPSTHIGWLRTSSNFCPGGPLLASVRTCTHVHTCMLMHICVCVVHRQTHSHTYRLLLFRQGLTMCP